MRTRVAIIHDNLLEFGGSEQVLLSLLKLHPDAALYTFFVNLENPQIKERFGKYHWHTSFIQSLPGLAHLQQYFSLLKPLAWWYFAKLDLEGYDLVITSCHSYNSKMVKVQNGAKHLCYLYTPPRFLYGFAHELERFTRLPIGNHLLSIFKQIDQKAAQNPDQIIVSSKEVQSRVMRIYGRKSLVVSPPVSQLSTKITQQKEYYVAHSRLVKQKNIELIVAACTRYNLPLKVVGDGYLRNELERNAGKSVQFLGFVPDQKLARVYRSARALIYAADDEDFGIVPVEAQSAGVPVIAYRSGGVTETVVNGVTGYFFNELTIESMMKAVRKLERAPLSSLECRMQAKKFDYTRFMKDMKSVIQDLLTTP